MGLLQEGQIDAEAPVGRFGAGDGLEHQIHGHIALDELQGVGDMGQDAGLGGNVETLDHLVEHLVQAGEDRQVVAGRVDADHRIPGAIQEAIEHGGGNALGIVRGVVRLQPHAEPAG